MTIPIRTFRKDPDAVLDYALDWSEQWLQSADVIETSTWSVDPAGLTIGTGSNDGTKTSVWLSGGTAGVTYTVTNRITTEAGRTDDASFQVIVSER